MDDIDSDEPQSPVGCGAEVESSRHQALLAAEWSPARSFQVQSSGEPVPGDHGTGPDRVDLEAINGGLLGHGRCKLTAPARVGHEHDQAELEPSMDPRPGLPGLRCRCARDDHHGAVTVGRVRGLEGMHMQRKAASASPSSKAVCSTGFRVARKIVHEADMPHGEVRRCPYVG